MIQPNICRFSARRASLIRVFAAAIFAMALPGQAGVFKCKADDGGPIYQEDPCPPGRELRNFDTDPPNLSVIPGQVNSAPGASGKSGASTEKAARRTDAGRDDASIGRVNGNAAERKFIRAGMTDAEVRAKIGQPDMTSGGSRSRNTRWSYLPAEGDPDTITTIVFAGNTVAEVTRKVVKR